MARIYLGLRGCDVYNGQTMVREIFRCDTTPTFATHGKIYNAVIGPFRKTMRGARFMRELSQKSELPG